MIIAVDFDGVLFENRFPEIGGANYEVISFVRQLMDQGNEVILWTSRAGERLREAVDACEDYGLHFCAVNSNAPSNLAQYSAEYPDPSPKVYADLYLDDRDPWFMNYMLEHRNREGAALRVMVDNTRKCMRKMEADRRMREAMDRNGVDDGQ